MADTAEQLREHFQKHARGERVGEPLGLTGRNDTPIPELLIDEIEPDPDQPRKDLGDLEELKASIRQVGIIQPIIVTIIGENRYRLLAGERRYTAAKELGLDTIPAIVRTVDEHRRLEVQIIENVQRKDLDALEEAKSYRRLMEEHNYTQEEVARRVGKDQTTISQTVRVLDLPEDIQADYVTSHKVSKYLLLEVVRSPAQGQRELWNRIKTGDIRTVSEARQARKEASQGEGAEGQERPAPVKFHYASKDKAILCSVTFRDGNADESDLLKVLQAWTRDVKKALPAKDAPGDGQANASEQTQEEDAEQGALPLAAGA